MKNRDRFIIVGMLVILASTAVGLYTFDELRPEKAMVSLVSLAEGETPLDGEPEGTVGKSAVTGDAVKMARKDGLSRTSQGNLVFHKDGKCVKNTLIRNNGRIFYFGRSGAAFRKKWKTIDGQKYYFRESGRAAIGTYKIKNRFRVFDEKGRLAVTKDRIRVVRVRGKKFIVKRSGFAAKGWFEVGGRMVHTRKNGAFDRRKMVSYIPMNGKGYAKNSEQAKAKLLAQHFIARHTEPSDSRVEKFRKCFRHIIAYCAYKGDWRPQGFGEKGWQYRSAIEMFSFGLVGDCYGVSCAVAACAKELGYQPYVIWATCSHSFVIIDGKFYDNMYGAKFGATSRPAWTTKEKFKF